MHCQGTSFVCIFPGFSFCRLILGEWYVWAVLWLLGRWDRQIGCLICVQTELAQAGAAIWNTTANMSSKGLHGAEEENVERR